MKSDEDALPQEHEQLHRLLVDKLIEGGIVQAGEIGKITIEREAEEGEAAPAAQAPQEERRALDQGN